jgi:UPF0755 protein
MKFIVKGLFLLVVLAGLAGSYYYYSQYTNYLQQPIHISDLTQSYEVKKGSHLNSVAMDLEKQDILKPALFFKILAKLSKQENKIKAGEFELTADMKPADVLELFTSGKSVQYQQTIIEGQSFKQLVESIKKNTSLKQTLTDDDYDYANIMKKIGSDFSSPEGAFFADTYSFPKNTTDLDFLKRSHKMLVEVLENAWKNRMPEEAIKTPYEALILASIVEKETGTESERPMIARVFINRLNKTMLLQTDPTVIYGMGDTYDGNIRKKDLLRDTPYNTYTRPGLPPTPIATPGKAAIKAVMFPADGDVLYFVAKGDGSGESYFTKSNAEHNKAVARYLKNRRELNRKNKAIEKEKEKSKDKQ